MTAPVPLHLRSYATQDALAWLQVNHITDPIEQNVFLHSGFLGAALQSLGTVFNGENGGLLTISADDATDKPLFAMPFEIKRPGIGFNSAITSWSIAYATQGTPLLSSSQPKPVLQALLRQLADKAFPDVLMLPNMRCDAPVAQLLQTIAREQGLPVQIIGEVKQPVLCSYTDTQSYLTQAIGKNHLRDYRRLWRRLSEQGDLRYSVVQDNVALSAAFESFLQLEAAGWKGKSASALASQTQVDAFARQAIANLSDNGLVRIHQLKLDGRLIASLVVFVEGNQAWTWKTAYDENWRSFSPGVLLMLEMLKLHLSDPTIRYTDSCATPDHPVMARLFQERESFATLLIGLHPGSKGAVQKIATQINRYDRLRKMIHKIRNTAKALLRRASF